MEIMRWCLPAQNTMFQLRICECTIRKVTYRSLGVKLSPITCDVKNILLSWQGNIVPHYI